MKLYWTWGRATLNLRDETIPLNVDLSKGNALVARVTVANRQVVPPNSVMRVKCTLSQEIPEYLIEPEDHLKVLIPRSLHSETKQPWVCVMNITDKQRLMEKGDIIATARKVDEVVDPLGDDPPEETKSVFNTDYGPPLEMPEAPTTVPPHLQAVFASSRAQLTEEQQTQFGRLLNEFCDVFARDEYDLGEFTEVTHGIDTGDARPIKQRIRRTPAAFVQEEEAHLKKMLDAGVIQESTSEWASAPVLIRKRDGSVRWCIDYRALNNVTTKDVFPYRWWMTVWILWREITGFPN